MAVFVRKEGSVGGRSRERWVRRAADRMLFALGLGARELSIVLCDDRVMRGLNRRYRRKNRPTDVLSFAVEPFAPRRARPPRMTEPLGDIVISVPTAIRQARQHCHSVDREILALLAHGLLHLLGYDHPTRRAERQMTARADMLCAAALGRSATRARSWG